MASCIVNFDWLFCSSIAEYSYSQGYKFALIEWLLTGQYSYTRYVRRYAYFMQVGIQYNICTRVVDINTNNNACKSNFY